MAEGQVLQLAIEVVQAQPVGDRRVDLERLAGDARRLSGAHVSSVRMLCRRSASLMRMTRTSRAIASSILRKFSACASSWDWNSILSSLETPSTSSATTLPKRSAISALVMSVSSITSCSSAAISACCRGASRRGSRPPRAGARCRARRSCGTEGGHVLAVLAAAAQAALQLLHRGRQDENADRRRGTGLAHLLRTLPVDLQQDVAAGRHLLDDPAPRGAVVIAVHLGALEEVAPSRMARKAGTSTKWYSRPSTSPGARRRAWCRTPTVSAHDSFCRSRAFRVQQAATTSRHNAAMTSRGLAGAGAGRGNDDERP
jgi:hypothetical protein